MVMEWGSKKWDDKTIRCCERMLAACLPAELTLGLIYGHTTHNTSIFTITCRPCWPGEIGKSDHDLTRSVMQSRSEEREKPSGSGVVVVDFIKYDMLAASFSRLLTGATRQKGNNSAMNEPSKRY